MQPLKNGITAPKGFQASGIHCGIKKDKPDLAVVLSQTNATVAGVFTTSKTCAPPVQVCREYLKKGTAIRGVIVNSGNANASSGLQGYQNAVAMTRITAQCLGVESEKILVCSTGRIGVPLPMDKITAGIKSLVDIASSDGSHSAAQAIITTDKYTKERAYSFNIDGVDIRIGAMAKGAGMIEPHMATMLAFITTDANIDASFLQHALTQSVDTTFNRICVDGDMSTNDSVILLANAQAGNTLITKSSVGADMFRNALTQVCQDLAQDIVRDGEGAKKVVQITVQGAIHTSSATRIARMVARSVLFKVALGGNDPNWGRIMAAVGYADRVEIDQHKIDIFFNDIQIVSNGRQSREFTERIDEIKRIWAKQFFLIRIDLHLGEESDTYYTCDIGHPYIDINNH